MQTTINPNDRFVVIDDAKDHVQRTQIVAILAFITLGGLLSYTFLFLETREPITGDIGHNGTIGATGATGPIGPIGGNGINGVTGATGKTGEVGSVGFIGFQGPRGFNCWDVNQTNAPGSVELCVGPIGPTGNTGTTGNRGITGPTGASGGLKCYDKLFTGTCVGINDANGDGVCNITDCVGSICDPVYNLTTCKGHGGATGAIGIRGPTGAEGAASSTAGPTGNTGCQCYKTICKTTYTEAEIVSFDVNHDGVLNSNDCVGPVGAQGVQGDQGNVGVAGIKGVNGTKGAKGDTGNQGSIGPTGPTGPTGADANPCWTGLGTDTMACVFPAYTTEMVFNLTSNVFYPASSTCVQLTVPYLVKLLNGTRLFEISFVMSFAWSPTTSYGFDAFNTNTFVYTSSPYAGTLQLEWERDVVDYSPHVNSPSCPGQAGNYSSWRIPLNLTTNPLRISAGVHNVCNELAQWECSTFIRASDGESVRFVHTIIYTSCASPYNFTFTDFRSLYTQPYAVLTALRASTPTATITCMMRVNNTSA